LWLINFLPIWVFHITLAFSLVAFIVSIFLNIRNILIASTILIAICAYFVGIHSNNDVWEAKVNELQTKVTLAEQISKSQNKEIVTKLVTKIKYVKEVVHGNTEYITEYVTKELDRECKLTDASILLHNSASQNELARSSGDIDAGTQEVKAGKKD
jgi:cell division protein FtsX